MEVFLSYNFSKSDNLVDMVKEICRALDVRAITGESADPRPPLTKVKELIAETPCHGLIQVVVDDRDNEWLDAEAGMVVGLEKPFVIFFKEGVNISKKFVQTATSYNQIDVELPSGIGNIVAGIQNLILKIKEKEAAYSLPGTISREKILTLDEIRPNLQIIRKVAITLKCETGQVETLDHGFYSDLPHDDFNLEGVSIKLISDPAKSQCTMREMFRDRHMIRFAITFKPRLKEGDSRKYSYCFEGNPDIPMFSEQIGEFRHRYPYKDGYTSNGWLITMPTGELLSEMRFPRGYVPMDARVNLYIGDSHDPISGGHSQDPFSFDQDDLFDEYVLRLKVRRPYVHHTYAIEWKPPSFQEFSAYLDKNDMPKPFERFLPS